MIARAGNRPPPNRGHFDGGMSGGGRQITHEMLIPGAKCGLVIGKGGETIKNIQVNQFIYCRRTFVHHAVF